MRELVKRGEDVRVREEEEKISYRGGMERWKWNGLEEKEGKGMKRRQELKGEDGKCARAPWISP